MAALGIQPALGVLHHRQYTVSQRRGAVSHVHIWWGRALMVLGVVNGGLGLQLAMAPNSVVIAYSVIAAVMFAAYAVAKVVTSFCRGDRRRGSSSSSSRNKEAAAAAVGARDGDVHDDTRVPRRPHEDDNRRRHREQDDEAPRYREEDQQRRYREERRYGYS